MPLLSKWGSNSPGILAEKFKDQERLIAGCKGLLSIVILRLCLKDLLVHYSLKSFSKRECAPSFRGNIPAIK